MYEVAFIIAIYLENVSIDNKVFFGLLNSLVGWQGWVNDFEDWAKKMKQQLFKLFSY